MRRTIIVTLALLWLAGPAHASTWRKGCTETSTLNSMLPGMFACATPTSATDDTNIIGVQDCENIDVGMVADSNGDGTGATALTATLQWCPISQLDATVNTDTKRDAACVDIANNTVTGDGTLQGAGIPSGYIRINFGGTFAADPKVWIRCNR